MRSVNRVPWAAAPEDIPVAQGTARPQRKAAHAPPLFRDLKTECESSLIKVRLSTNVYEYLCDRYLGGLGRVLDLSPCTHT